MHGTLDREVWHVKGILVLAVLLLSGCSGMVPLEELEARALRTGDWTEVEKRERIIARRRLRTGIACPSGMLSYCDRSYGADECRCLDNTVINAFFRR